MTERGYRKINDDHQKQVACYALGCQEGDKIARRVAAEIFAEIERFMLDGAIGGKYPTKLINPDKYAELKKKYIGKDTNVTTKDTGEGK